MLARSFLSPPFAEAHTSVWQAESATPVGDSRPAPLVAPGYAEHRDLMVCNYWAFAHYRKRRQLVCQTNWLTLLYVRLFGWCK